MIKHSLVTKAKATFAAALISATVNAASGTRHGCAFPPLDPLIGREASPFAVKVALPEC